MLGTKFSRGCSAHGMPGLSKLAVCSLEEVIPMYQALEIRKNELEGTRGASPANLHTKARNDKDTLHTMREIIRKLCIYSFVFCAFMQVPILLLFNVTC